MKETFKVRYLCLTVALTNAGSALAQDGVIKTLPPVNVRAAAESAYAPSTSKGGTRTETPIEYIPQSVVVVSRAIIEDQGSSTLSDALRNVSNVTQIDSRDSNNVTFRIRGFRAATVVDGVATPGYFPNLESLINIERIDVVKGPAGGLFGSTQSVGSPATLGGTLAITTSEPVQSLQRRVGLRVGDFGESAVSFDINQPFNSAMAFRIAGEVGRSGSETDQVYFRKIALFPSLSWSPYSATKVVLRMRYLDNATLDYSGLPPFGTSEPAAYGVPRNRNVTATGMPATTNTQHGINLQWTQVLNKTWTFSLTAAHNQAKVDQRGAFTFPFGGAGPVHFVAGARLWDEFKSDTLSPSLTAKFDTGAANHTVSLGVDYESTADDAFLVFSPGFGVLGFMDITNPVYPAWAEPVAPGTPDQKNRYKSTTAYVQDQIDIGNWHLLGGLRHSSIKVDDVNVANVPPIANHSDNRKLLPRLGVVYEFTPRVSAFAGYNEGSKIPSMVVFSQSPKPEESKQTELGMRLKAFAGVTATLAWFKLDRTNVTVPDPANLGRSIQSGKQQSRGLDLDVRWQATPYWTWIASATSQKAKITEDTNAALVNKQLFNVPERSLRLAGRYDFLTGDFAGLGLGMGLTHHSRLPGDTTNSFFTPSATVWDAQASFRMRSVKLGLGVNNLTDRKYYVPSNYFGGGQVVPALPRTFVATADISF